MRKGLLAPHNRDVMVNGKICSYAIKSRMALHDLFIHWASCQIRKIKGCACARNAGNVFPTADKRSRHASRHVREARDAMLAGIANLWSRWRRKCSRHSRNPQFTYLTRGRLHDTFIQCSTRDIFIWYHNDPFPLRMLWIISLTFHLRNRHTVCVLSCFVGARYRPINPYPSWLLQIDILHDYYR